MIAAGTSIDAKQIETMSAMLRGMAEAVFNATESVSFLVHSRTMPPHSRCSESARLFRAP